MGYFKTQFQMFGTFAIAGAMVLTGASTAQGSQVLIDDFDASGQVEVDDFADGSQTEEGEVWDQFAGGNPLGGSRDIGVVEESDNGGQDSGIAAGMDNAGPVDEFFLEQGPGVQGRAWIQWDGDDSGEGSPEFSDVATDNLNVDLVDGTNDAILFTGIDNDSSDNLATLHIYTDDGDVWRNTQALPQQDTQTLYEFAHFSGGSGNASDDFQNVNAVQLTFHGRPGTDAPLPSANDFAIGAVTTRVIPTPSAVGGGLAMLALAGAGAAVRRFRRA